jgi:hypothetical protein
LSRLTLLQGYDQFSPSAAQTRYLRAGHSRIQVVGLAPAWRRRQTGASWLVPNDTNDYNDLAPAWRRR